MCRGRPVNERGRAPAQAAQLRALLRTAMLRPLLSRAPPGGGPSPASRQLTGHASPEKTPARRAHRSITFSVQDTETPDAPADRRAGGKVWRDARSGMSLGRKRRGLPSRAAARRGLEGARSVK